MQVCASMCAYSCVHTDKAHTYEWHTYLVHVSIYMFMLYSYIESHSNFEPSSGKKPLLRNH